MAGYILYPTKRFVANVPPVNFFVRSFVCRSFVVCSARSFRWREFVFDGAKIFENKVWVDAIDFVQNRRNRSLSSRFLSRSKFQKFTCHFLAKFADRPGIYIETLYESNFPRYVCRNSSKSGG